MAGFYDVVVWFAVCFGLVYGATLAAYFGLCMAIEAVNRRNPERRIQKQRRGETRKAVEIRQSVMSIAVTALSVSFGLTAQHAGWTPFAPWTLSWWNALPLFLLCMVLFDAWFYWAHRLLHTRAFYRFHRFHHLSLAPTVWSNDAIGAVDTALSQGFYAVVVFVVPFPPLLLLAHRAFDHVNGTIGHAGFEYFASPTARLPWPMLCTTFHDQHHAEFRYNFANYFSVWDRLCRTVAPDYDRRVVEMEANLPPVTLAAQGSQSA